MTRLILVLFGAAAGAAGTVSWLLSEPEVPATSSAPVSPGSVQERWQELNRRVRVALAEGQQSGQETEARLRRELNVYRSGGRPSAS